MMSKEGRQPLRGDFISGACVDAGSGCAGTNGIDRGSLRIFDERKQFRKFSLQRTYGSGTGQIAPITVDARRQFNQNQIPVLKATSGRTIESAGIRAVRAGLHHGPTTGVKDAIASNLLIDG